jgi:hypothetical protein
MSPEIDWAAWFNVGAARLKILKVSLFSSIAWRRSAVLTKANYIRGFSHSRRTCLSARSSGE